MDVDDCNGQSYIPGRTSDITDELTFRCLHFVQMTNLAFMSFSVAASGDSSMEREFTGALGGPTVSTPNSKETSPSRSLSGLYENKCDSLELPRQTHPKLLYS